MSSESLSASPSPASVPSAQPAIAPSGPVSNELDLVFCIDTTGSMGSYISSAQENMKNIVTMIVASEKADVQVAIVAYKDFNDPYVTKTFDFTDSVNKMKANIDMLEASGGGDTPEAITAGLHDCLNLPYRKSSTKVVVLIGDAPDHGLGESGDSFPNGDKDGRDPIKIAREMLSRGIVIYSVACEPSLSSSQFGRDFFMTLARITQGQFLPLTSAKLLSDVIVGGAKEEISLQRIQEEVEAESKRIREEKERAKVAYSERDIAEEVSSTLQRKGVVVNKVRVDEVYAAYDYANVESMECASSLSEARSKMKSGLNRAAPSAPSDAFAYSSSALDECESVKRRPAAAPSFLGRVRNSFSSMFGGPSAPAPAPAASFGDYGAPAPAPSSYGDYAMAPPVPSMAYAAPASSLASSAAPAPVQQAYISSSLVDSEQVLRVMNKSKSRAY